MKQPFKSYRGPGECIGACIAGSLHPVTAPSAETKGRVFPVGQPSPACFSFSLKYKLWFLSSWPNQWAIYLRCLQHQNRLPQNLRQNLCEDQRQNPWWNLIRYFSVFSALWCVFWFVSCTSPLP